MKSMQQTSEDNTRPATADATKREEPGIWHVLVCGIPRPAKSLELGPSLFLKPLEVPLSVFDLANAGSAGFREWAVIEPIAHSVTAELVSSRDAQSSGGYDHLNRAWLAASMVRLRGFGHFACPACSDYSWNLVAGSTRAGRRSLPPFRGGLIEYHLNYFVPPDSFARGIVEEDADWIRDHFVKYEALAAESLAFNFALQASDGWRYEKDARSAVAKIWAGIESLFDVNSEITFRMAAMAASVLYPRGSERERQFRAIKKLYDKRSGVVHGVMKESDETTRAAFESYALLRQLLLEFVRLGRVPSKPELEAGIFL